MTYTENGIFFGVIAEPEFLEDLNELEKQDFESWKLVFQKLRELKGSQSDLAMLSEVKFKGQYFQGSRFEWAKDLGVDASTLRILELPDYRILYFVDRRQSLYRFFMLMYREDDYEENPTVRRRMLHVWGRFTQE